MLLLAPGTRGVYPQVRLMQRVTTYDATRLLKAPVSMREIRKKSTR